MFNENDAELLNVVSAVIVTTSDKIALVAALCNITRNGHLSASGVGGGCQQ